MTAPAPFSRDTVTYLGALPDSPPVWDVRSHRMWLGKPGNMIELPSADPENYSAPQSRGEVLQGLAGGGSGVTRFANTVGSWSIAWQRLAGADRSRIDAFYRGIYAPGPYCWVPPEDVNRLSLAQSLCGLRNAVAEGWSIGSGALTYDPTQSAVIAPCGVLRWSGAAQGALLSSCPHPPTSSVTTPDPLFTAPYLPAEPLSASMWAWAASGTVSVRLIASGRLANGTTTAQGTTSAILTTAPQLLQVAVAPGALLGAQYVVAQLMNVDPSQPDILFSNPQLEYRDFRTDWALGSGVPRVHIAPDGRDTRTFDVHMNEGATITLVDAVAGRA